MSELSPEPPSWSPVRGVTGRAMLAALTPLGARATLTDDSPSALTAFAQHGVAVIDPANAAEQIADFDLVVTSPGLPADRAGAGRCRRGRVPIWGDVELAWRLDSSGRYGPPRRWLVVTGTNGKTTTTSMLHAMLEAAGRRALLCGNIGDPVLDVLDRARRAAGRRAVQLPAALGAVAAPGRRRGAQRRRGPPRLARHDGRLRARQGPRAGRPGRRRRARRPGRGRPAADRRCAGAGRFPARRAGAGRARACATACSSTTRSATELALAEAASIPVAGPVGVLDALAAAALARAVDVPPEAIADGAGGRSGWAGTAPRWSTSSTASRYVDDSKATNPHAAQASITAYPRVVWIAGGLLKGASVDELVAAVANRLVGAVLIGRDRDPDPRRVIATRPGCPRSRGCDRGGFWGAWAN